MSKKGGVDPENFVKNLQKIWPNFKITIQQIKNPTKDFLISYFTTFFNAIGEDVDREMSEINLDRALYEDLIPMITNSKMLKEKILGPFSSQLPIVEDINVGNFLLPKPKIIHVLLSTTYNYLVFYLQQIDKLCDYEQHNRKLYIGLAEAEEQEKDLIDLRNRLAAHKSEAELAATEIQKDEDLNAAELKEIDDNDLKLDTSFDAEEAETAELDKEIQLVEERKEELDEKLRTINAISETKTEIENMKCEIIKVNEEDKSLTEALKIKNTYESELNLKLESEIFTQSTDNLIETYKEREEEELNLKVLKRQIQDTQTSIDFSNGRIKELEKENEQLGDKFSKIREIQLDDLVSKQQDVSEQVNNLNKAMDEAEEKYLEKITQLSEVYDKIEQINDASKTFDEYLLKCFAEILTFMEGSNDSFINISNKSNKRQRRNAKK